MEDAALRTEITSGVTGKYHFRAMLSVPDHFHELRGFSRGKRIPLSLSIVYLLKLRHGEELLIPTLLQVYDVVQRERRPVSMVRIFGVHFSSLDQNLSLETCSKAQKSWSSRQY